MTRPEARRRYLEANKDAAYTGLPDRAKAAHEETMRRLAQKHEGLHEEAAAGSDQDFDKPLTPELREHQRYLRDKHGLTHGQVLARRKAMRGGTKPTRPPQRPRGAVRTGARAARSHYRTSRALRATGLPSTASSTGSVVMQAVGIGIALSLVYLILSNRGSKAFSGVLNGVSGALAVLIAPVDPFNPNAGKRAAASRSSESNTTPAFSSPRQRQNLNPKFGPAPGIGTVIQPIGAQR